MFHLYCINSIHIVNILEIASIYIVLMSILFLALDNRKESIALLFLGILFFSGYEYRIEQEIRNEDYQSIVIEDNFDIQYRGLQDDYAVYVGNLIYDIQEKLIQYQLLENWHSVTIERTYYFPWEGADERTPFKINKDGRLVVQCSSHLMLKLRKDEIFLRTFSELLNSQNRIQDGLVQLLQEKVQYEIYSENKRNYFSASEIANIKNFYDNMKNGTFDYEMQTYGKLDSPKWVFYTEIINNYIETLPKIYEIAGSLETKDGFIQFLEKIEQYGIFNESSQMNSIIYQIRYQEIGHE